MGQTYNEDLIKRRIEDIDAQYNQVIGQLAGLDKTIRDLKQCANWLIRSGDFNINTQRMSNEAWRKRASETIKELMRIDSGTYPTFNSVLIPIYIKLRDVHGVVLDQLRKDYKYKYDLLRSPSGFEAISDDDTVRDIFDSLLVDMFPKNYFKDEAIEMIEAGNTAAYINNSPEETIIKIILPLATKSGDDSYGYINTFDSVCSQMECSWGNLQTRYMNRNNLKEPPSKALIILSNPNVMRKFKKTVRAMLDKYDKT